MELTTLRALSLAGVIFCSGFGFLLLISPNSAHSLSQGLNRTIITLETTFGKRPRMSGGMLLLVSFLLLFFLY